MGSWGTLHYLLPKPKNQPKEKKKKTNNTTKKEITLNWACKCKKHDGEAKLGREVTGKTGTERGCCFVMGSGNQKSNEREEKI